MRAPVASHAMRSSGGYRPVPSTSLLRFLRSQAEEPCFFTANSSPISCQRSRRGMQQSFDTKFSASIRSLTTSVPRRADVDPFDFAFLRPGTLQGNILSGFTRHVSCINPESDYSQCSRQASTISRPLFKRLWNQKSRSSEPNVRASDLPPLPSFIDDVGGTSLGRSKTGKSGSELKLRCTEIDENGNVTTVNGEFKKSELIAKVWRCPLRRRITAHMCQLMRCVVWTSPARSSQDRFLSPSPHTGPTVGYTHQPSPPASLDQT